MLLAVIVISILYKLGKGILLPESIALMYTLTCLVMPSLGYSVYNQNNFLARVFIKYMMVPDTSYFGLALPAISLFVFAVTLPIRNQHIADSGPLFMRHMARIKAILKNDVNYALYIIAFGFVMLVVSPLLPGEIRFFAELFYFASFAAVLYIFNSNNRKLKMIILPIFVISLAITALNSRMFTVVVYMGITIYSFFFIGSNASFLKKLSLFVTGILLVLVLQNVKSIYRTYTEKRSYSGNKAQLFAEITLEQLSRGDALVEKNSFFPVFVRFNQGWNISMVLRRIPAQQDYDNGKQLLRVAFASLVPRFLWPDKPEAGGKFNMMHYAGLVIVGWSTNVGPLGEAYGSFGTAGGIVYIFLLGLFIRFVYKKVFIYSVKNPLLLLWLPVLFYKVTYSSETDTLQILNSLFKTGFFIWLLYKFLPSWFGKTKKATVRKRASAIPYNLPQLPA
jgi:hypothetical protein